MGKKDRLKSMVRKPGEKGEKSSDAKVSEVGPSQVRDAKDSEVGPTQVRDAKDSEVSPAQVRDAKDSEVSPAQVRGDEREVPECAKVAGEEQKHKNKNCCLNVLLIGQTGAGKKKAQRKILELHLDNIRKHGTKDLSRHMAHSGINEEADSKDNRIIFGTPFDTEKAKFYLLLAPYYLGFVPGFMRKASQADIAVLFISGCKDDADNREQIEETLQCLFLIIALCIPKIVLVVNKVDDPSCTKKSYEHIKSGVECSLARYGSISTRIAMCLPVSGELGLNIHTRLVDNECKWWEGPCLFEALETIEVPVRSFSLCTSDKGALASVKKLVQLDLLHESKPFDSANWFERAKLLANIQRIPEAFEAALKASENPFETLSYREDSSPFSALIQGHQYRANGDIKNALSCYLSVKECFKNKKFGDKTLSIMTQIITEVVEEEKNREVSRQNLLKKKEKEETKEFSVAASLNKEDEVEKSEVRKVSRQNPLKKKMKEETEEFSGASSQNKDDEAEKSEVGVMEIGYPTNFNTSVSGTNETQRIDKFRIDEVELSISPNYELRTVLNSVYSGSKIIKCINRSAPRSFIKCLASQTASYEKLEYLGLNGFNILNIEDAVDIKNEICFVVQPVKTLDAFFELELQNYWATSQKGMSDTENWTNDIRAVILSEWWQFIEVKFKKIFNGVVDGLLFLDSMGYRCGDLSFAIYITDEGHSRLLPTMDSMVKPAEDIHDLVKCMRRVVFRVCPSSPSWMQNDLDHFFGFLNPKKLKYVPLRWLLNHYFFWSPRERIQFIHNLRHLKSGKMYKSICGLLVEEMRKKDPNYCWTDELPAGIFLEIWRMGDPERSPSTIDRETLKQSGLVEVLPYTKRDIIRYMVAVYTHYNGQEYSEFRDEILDAVAIERKLVEIFPDIYGLIMDALHALIEQRVRRGKSIEDLNELLKDSSQHIDK